jgi:hypothetical protein
MSYRCVASDFDMFLLPPMIRSTDATLWLCGVWGFAVDKVAMGQVFLRVLQFFIIIWLYIPIRALASLFRVS